VLLLFLAACNPAAPPAASRQAAEPTTTAPTSIPADISHGEAHVGSPDTTPPVDPRAPAPSREHLHRVRLEIRHATVTVDSGIPYDAWTFGGHVPGPVLRARQGDTVEFTLVNHAPMPHSMDFHAAEIAPDKYYRNLMPGDSLQYRFVPRVPGVFMYHCGTAPVAAHIANGMYGAFIVDPASPRPAAEEYVLVQSEFYTTGDTLHRSPLVLDWAKLLSLAPDYVVFNGRAAQYARHPIPVPVGGLLRLYVVNAGPNRVSSFHVVGGIFDRVFPDGAVAHPLEGVQTASVPVGGSAIFELRLKQAGVYPFVTHAFADATKGAVGMFAAEARAAQ
jgi:nitrite reductase (NO-forming)